jgi:hypothetical protein
MMRSLRSVKDIGDMINFWPESLVVSGRLLAAKQYRLLRRNLRLNLKCVHMQLSSFHLCRFILVPICTAKWRAAGLCLETTRRTDHLRSIAHLPLTIDLSTMVADCRQYYDTTPIDINSGPGRQPKSKHSRERCLQKRLLAKAAPLLSCPTFPW